MNNDQIQELLKTTLDHAKNAGVDGADLIFSRGESFSVNTENKNIGQYKVSSAQSIGVRVQCGQKIGVCSSESLEENALKIMIDQAINNAKYSKDSPFETIAAEKSPVFDGTIKEDYQTDETEARTKVDFCMGLETSVLEKDKRVQNVPYNGYSDSKGETWIANTNGVMSFAKETTASCYTSALMDEENKNQAMYYHSDVGRKFSDLSRDKVVEKTLFHTGQFLEGKPITTGKYDIIFDRDLVESLLGSFLNLFSGKQAIAGLNPWKEKINEVVAHEQLSIRDNPNFPHAFGNGLFDSEGFATSELALMEKGKLLNFLQNSATAKELGMTHSANAARSSKSNLSVGTSNLIIDAGTTADSELYSGDYVELIELQGMHSGTDNISGNFSFGATGYLRNNGETKQVVRGVTISGNFFDLVKNIRGIGTDCQFSSGRAFYAPEIRFADLTIAGN